jgi:hypothetical protein
MACVMGELRRTPSEVGDVDEVDGEVTVGGNGGRSGSASSRYVWENEGYL